MNTTNLLWITDSYQEACIKITLIVLLAVSIHFINFVLVITFFLNPVFQREPRYVLFINFLINDILMISISVALFFLTYALPGLIIWTCCPLIAIASTSFMSTSLNLACMALERYIAISKPLHHSQICTLKKTYILISFIWGVGAIPAVTDIIILALVKPGYFDSFTICQPAFIYNTQYHVQKAIVTNALYMSVVWITLIYTYIRVYFIVKRSSSIQNRSSAQKARNTIFLHGSQLIICMLSYLTPVLDKLLIPCFPAHRTKISFINYLLTNIIPRLLSPLIYGIRDQKFAKYIKSYFIRNVVVVKLKSAM